MRCYSCMPFPLFKKPIVHFSLHSWKSFFSQRSLFWYSKAMQLKILTLINNQRGTSYIHFFNDFYLKVKLSKYQFLTYPLFHQYQFAAVAIFHVCSFGRHDVFNDEGIPRFTFRLNFAVSHSDYRFIGYQD